MIYANSECVKFMEADLIINLPAPVSYTHLSLSLISLSLSLSNLHSIFSHCLPISMRRNETLKVKISVLTEITKLTVKTAKFQLRISDANMFIRSLYVQY